MPSFRTGQVAEILSERVGLQRVSVDLGADPERAYVLTALTGRVDVGDPVVVNTTAVELGLGTGGWHVVHWNLARDSWSEPGPGHIMKLRYTSLQADVGTAEESYPDLPPHLDGTPVVVCSLHSQVGVVAATIQHVRPFSRVVYVMTDGAALPMALSDLVADLVGRGTLAATITAGHAFGGQYEAVTVPSALAVARHLAAAEIIVVGMGPGVVGTGTALGTTAVEVATIADTVAALGGHPVVCVRASEADGRARHQGMSHHTTTALSLARTRLDVAVPAESGLVAPAPHRTIALAVPDVGGLLDAARLRITSMGRDADADPLFFSAAGAAAVRATDLLGPRR